MDALGKGKQENSKMKAKKGNSRGGKGLGRAGRGREGDGRARIEGQKKIYGKRHMESIHLTTQLKYRIKKEKKHSVAEHYYS